MWILKYGFGIGVFFFVFGGDIDSDCYLVKCYIE